MKRIDNRDIRHFRELTRAALGEPEIETFVERLLQRESMAAGIAEFVPAINNETAGELYGEEMRVIERLEAERSKLFTEIDLYAQSKKAMRSYRSKFPLPSVHAFFEKKD